MASDFISVQFNLQEFVRDLETQTARSKQRLALAVTDTAEEVKRRVEESMQAPKSGRIYGSHQASAPGEAPAIDSRELIESGRIEPTGPFSADVVYDSPHAAPLELGAPARGLEPRPFLGPAMEAEREEFPHRVADALQPVGASGRVRRRVRK